jgi:hypothetical protein
VGCAHHQNEDKIRVITITKANGTGNPRRQSSYITSSVDIRATSSIVLNHQYIEALQYRFRLTAVIQQSFSAMQVENTEPWAVKANLAVA